ncbi:MAG: acyl carrier protein [bacterium]
MTVKNAGLKKLTEEIRSMIAEIAEVEENEIAGEKNFVEDLGFDSMMALEIFAKLEKQYKIRIPEEELPRLSNLNQTVNLVDRYIH